MHLLKEKITLQNPGPTTDNFAICLGGYSYCFNIDESEDIEEALEVILNELFDDLVHLIKNDGIYAFGWMFKRYHGTGVYQ